MHAWPAADPPPPPSHCPACSSTAAAGLEPILLGAFSTICRLLLVQMSAPAFGGLQAPVRANPALQRQLVAQLQRTLGSAVDLVLAALPQAAAAGSGPPAGHLSSLGSPTLDWNFVSNTARVLSADCLRAALQQQLRQGDGAAAAVQLLERLLAGLPLAPPDGLPATVFGEVWATSAHFLSVVFVAIMRSQRAAAMQAAAWAAVRLLPRLAAALKVLAVGVPAIQQRVLSTAEIWGQLLTPALEIQTVSSMQQLEALVAAADAGLRLLPLLTQQLLLAAEPAGPLDVLQSLGTGLVGTRLYVQSICGLVTAGSELCITFLRLHRKDEDLAALSSSQLAAAATATSRLHATACRLVHWLAAMPPAELRRLLPLLSGWQGVECIAYGALELARMPQLAAQKRAAGGAAQAASSRCVPVLAFVAARCRCCRILQGRCCVCRLAMPLCLNALVPKLLMLPQPSAAA